METTKAIVGVFTYLDDALKAIAAVRETEHRFQVYAPTYIPEIEEATNTERSKAAIFTLIGGVCGLSGGFALAILCALDWPLRVSAKSIVSIPGFIVIGYECTILLGALFSLLGIFVLCRLPDLVRRSGYDPRFSDDKIGVVVGCGADDVDSVKSTLLDSGADEVDVRDGL